MTTPHHELTGTELAEKLGVKPVTIRQWRQRKKIHGVKRGPIWFYPADTKRPRDERFGGTE